MPPTVASLVAADLIESARDEHPLFDPKRHPDLILLRALSRYQRRFVPKINRVNTKFLTVELETALPLADFDAGITLPDYSFPVGVEVQSTSSETVIATVDLVAREARLRYGRAAYVWNNKLYLTGVANDWVGFSYVRFYYVAEVDPLTTYTGAGGTLVLPNAAEPCLVAYLSHFMAKRTQKTESAEAPDKRVFRDAWKEAEQDFLDELQMHTQAEVSVVREVF
jgi:hypothetical protein